jgi:hypothetical protein
MNVCEVDSPINSSNQYCMKFQYASNVDIHQIINYIRLKYTLNGKQYMYEYDSFENELFELSPSLVQYKLLLNTINAKLKSLPPNTQCHLIICLADEITNPSLMLKV